jgi:predicted transcriptional regulator of viral defense system
MSIAYGRFDLDNYRHLRHWVDDLPKVGRSSFSLGDAMTQFPDMPAANLRNALHRLSQAGKVRSVWRGFYAVALPEYGLDGSIPPVEYIDQLMAHVKADYYVALLSAASYQGASHQSPQVFQVMSDRQIRSKDVSGSRLEFAYKRDMPKSCIEQKTVKSGYINVSAPALTALDLVDYPSRSGGISNVASVLAELADSIDFGILDVGLLMREPLATAQRLGHLLESTLGEVELAQNLYDKCKEAGLRFSRTGLVAGQLGQGLRFDEKWKVVINYDMEVDG